MMSPFLQSRKNKHDVVAAYFKNPTWTLLDEVVHLWRPAFHLKGCSAHPKTSFKNQLQNPNLILSLTSAV